MFGVFFTYEFVLSTNVVKICYTPAKNGLIFMIRLLGIQKSPSGHLEKPAVATDGRYCGKKIGWAAVGSDAPMRAEGWSRLRFYG